MTAQNRNEGMELVPSDPADVTVAADLGVPAAVVWVVLFSLWALGQKNQRRSSRRSKSGLERFLEADERARKESDELVIAAVRREEEGW